LWRRKAFFHSLVNDGPPHFLDGGMKRSCLGGSVAAGSTQAGCFLKGASPSTPLRVPLVASLYHWGYAQGRGRGGAFKEAARLVDPAADTSAKAGALHAAVEKVRRTIVDKGVEKGLSAATKEKSPVPEVVRFQRHRPPGASASSGMLLTRARTKDVRAAAAKALRHWIDRGQKEDAGFYEALVAHKVKPDRQPS